MLTAIKLLHTVVWAIFAGSIVVLPFMGVFRRFRWAAILTGLVLLECGVLAVNGGRCPLSDLAQRLAGKRLPFGRLYAVICEIAVFPRNAENDAINLGQANSTLLRGF